MKKPHGFTLIELVVFMVVLGIIANLVFICYSSLFRGSPTSINQTTATELAAACLEWYIGQRHVNGFSSTSLNPGVNNIPAFCNTCLATASPGYSLSTNVSATLYGVSNPNYKTVTVTVDGPNKAKATLSTIIAQY